LRSFLGGYGYERDWWWESESVGLCLCLFCVALVVDDARLNEGMDMVAAAVAAACLAWRGAPAGRRHGLGLRKKREHVNNSRNVLCAAQGPSGTP
jgi:hypothetical protein